MIAQLKTSFPVRLAQVYGDSKSGAYASGLAFNAFMAMFPLILGLLAIVGFLVRDPGIYAQVEGMMLSIFPGQAQGELRPALQLVHDHAGILGLISIAGLVWSGTGLFSAMEFALNEVFGSAQRDFVRQRLMGLIMMVIFLVAILFAVGANSAASLVPLAPVGGFVVGSLVLIGLLIAIYREVPNRTFSVRQIWPGAVVAGIGIEILTLAFPIYGRLTHDFNTYGRQFALFFLLGGWLYFLSQFLLLGAVFNRMRLGDPTHEGLVAAPAQDSKSAPRPVEAIREQQAKAPGAGRSPELPTASQPPPNRRWWKSRVLYGVLGIAITATLTALLRRRHWR